MAIGDIKTFNISYPGLELEIIALDLGNGQVSFQVKCLSGFADINALYWGDGDKTAGEGTMSGFDAKKDSALNMNGSGEAWDGGMKLSSAGLGTAGVNKPTYLTANESLYQTATLDWASLDTLGVRATSTSTASGSIKGVDGDATPTEHPEVSMGDACVTEGQDATFTVSLSNSYPYDVWVQYHTADGTAGSGSDFTGASGWVKITAGSTEATISVATTDDLLDEGPNDAAHAEIFTLVVDQVKIDVNQDGDVDDAVDLTSATFVADGSGDGCIIDNDDTVVPPPAEDHFPDNGHNLSYATFYFDTTDGDIRGVLNGDPQGGKNPVPNTPDGVYTVKVEFSGTGAGNDLDDYFGDIMDYIIETDSNVDLDTVLLGVSIHAGEGNPQLEEDFYAIDNDPNDVDLLPTPPGDLAIGNEVDKSILYADVEAWLA